MTFRFWKSLLGTSPGERVVGVVHPKGACGAKAADEPLWTFTLFLQPWRRGSGSVDERCLHVRTLVEKEELKPLRDQFDPFQVVELRVEFTDTDSPTPGASLLKVISCTADDQELAFRAAELGKPTIIHHQLFGDLTLNRAIDCFEATSVSWCATNPNLSVCRDDASNPEAALETASALWAHQSEWDAQARACAIRDLLQLKNDNWLQESEDPLSSETFTDRMRLETIAVLPGGAFEFYYDDGDLFWGHTIVVRGTLENGATDADIAG
jgi:hypothetical protein